MTNHFKRVEDGDTSIGGISGILYQAEVLRLDLGEPTGFWHGGKYYHDYYDRNKRITIVRWKPVTTINHADKHEETISDGC